MRIMLPSVDAQWFQVLRRSRTAGSDSQSEIDQSQPVGAFAGTHYWWDHGQSNPCNRELLLRPRLRAWLSTSVLQVQGCCLGQLARNNPCFAFLIACCVPLA